MQVTSSFTSISQKPVTPVGYSVKCAPDTPLLPGFGDPTLLPRLFKLQCIIVKKVVEEYGYLYLYVPETLIAEIQCKHAQWIDTAITDYLKISAVCGVKKLSPRNAGRYTTILQTSYYGHIYPDCVIIRRPNQADLWHYITTMGSSGKPIQLPDPHYYW